MRERRIEISEDTKEILRRAVIEGNALRITEKLDRKVYLSVNDVLMAAGGKWNRKAKAHLFDGDPNEILGLAQENGFITQEYVVDQKKTMNQFFTPMFVAAQMVNMACIEDGHRVLEPSAGDGRILMHIAAIEEEIEITAYELDFNLAWQLEQEYPRAKVYCQDFLEVEPVHRFDRILMNPPFERGSDIEHILHARNMLAPEGILIAICADGPRQREVLQPIAYKYETLPERTFHDEGTDVSVALLTITRDGD